MVNLLEQSKFDKPVQEIDNKREEDIVVNSESLKVFGKQIDKKAEEESLKIINFGNQLIETGVKFTGGDSEDIAEGQDAVAGVQKEIDKLTKLFHKKINLLMEELLSFEKDIENQEKLIKKCQAVVEKIVAWSEKYSIDISHIKKLGGGFVNLVILIETSDGRGYVVKAFADDEEAGVMNKAQKQFDKLAKKDEKFIPKVIEWVDDETVISEKADGKPIRKILEEAKDSPEQRQEVSQAFYDLGKTLANIHERTERPFTEEDADNTRTDAEKLIKHLNIHNENGLFGITEDELEDLSQKIIEITKGGFISLIHGDAHLDQFFKSPNKSILTIVDYDSIQEGDPMADVARSLSSLRDWGRKLNVSDDLLLVAEKEFIKGYRSSRIEGEHSNESEFDQAKILVYELRLNLVQLKHFNKLREKIKSVLSEDQTEIDFYKTHKNSNAEDIKSYGFNEKEMTDIGELIAIQENTKEIIRYLQSIELK